MENHRLLLTVQDVTGHSEAEIKWNPKNKKQVESIQEMFIEMQKIGYIFFKVEKKLGRVNAKGEQIKKFDPKLKKMFMEKNLEWVPAEEESTSSQEAEFVDVEKEAIEPDKKYVAAQPLSGG